MKTNQKDKKPQTLNVLHTHTHTHTHTQYYLVNNGAIAPIYKHAQKRENVNNSIFSFCRLKNTKKLFSFATQKVRCCSSMQDREVYECRGWNCEYG